MRDIINYLHTCDCEIIGNVLLAKFKWFDSVISGSLYLRIVNKNRMEKGWWFELLPKRVKYYYAKMESEYGPILTIHYLILTIR
jgi:hypothetical protein